jgi:hypothetical protein
MSTQLTDEQAVNWISEWFWQGKKDKGLTLWDAGEMVGVSASTMRMIIRKKFASSKTLKKCRAFIENQNQAKETVSV